MELSNSFAYILFLITNTSSVFVDLPFLDLFYFDGTFKRFSPALSTALCVLFSVKGSL